jgi:uncharacterized membrane protein YidH (DUF202 family)
MRHADVVTTGRRNLVILTLVAAATALVAGIVAHHYRAKADIDRLFGSGDTDLTNAANAAALSNVALTVFGCCIVGLCVITAIRQMLDATK